MMGDDRMTYPKAILIGAVLIAAAIMLSNATPPAEAQQSGYNPSVAKCILQNLKNAQVDKAVGFLNRACRALNR